MKKTLCVVAVGAFFVGLARAETLELRVVSAGGTSEVHSNGCPFDVFIQGRLLDGNTAGLALWGANLNGFGWDLCDSTGFLLLPPSDMVTFDRNLGVTNPPGPPSEITGYSGTCDDAGNLLQLGGAQNTINNHGPTEYPVGVVITDIGHDGWQTLAEGRVTLDPGMGGTLALEAAFANTLDFGGGPEFYPVSVADVSIVGELTIIPSGCVSTSNCPLADINCDNIADGFDIAAIRRTDNWLHAVDEAADCRADVNGDGVVDGFDISVVRRTDCWLQ